MGETQPFVEEMLDNLASNICDLSSPQVQVFYEAMGHIISSKHELEEQQKLIQRLMQLPNNTWDDICRRAANDYSILGEIDVLKQIANLLKTNTAACRSIGGTFAVQLLRNFNDMLGMYQIMSEQISNAIDKNGPDVVKNAAVKQVKAVKKEILVFISTWASKNDVAGVS